MAQTVIGMFESSSKAEEAVQELVDAGFTRDRIDVSYNNPSYSSSDRTDNSDDNESGISKFFRSLFGNDDDDADKYSRVARHTQSIVTVHAESGDEAERAADILDDNGAVDVDEHASRYASTQNYSASGVGTDTATSTDLTDSDNISGTTEYTGARRSDTTFDTASNLRDDTTRTDTRFGTDSDLREDTTRNDTTFGTDLDRRDDTTRNDTTFGTDLDRRDDTTRNDMTFGTGPNLRDDTTADPDRKIPIIEENLEVGKREVRTGGVRLRSRIIERPVEETVRLRQERVNVERNPVDRPATEADLANFQEKDIELVERAEVPVVNKEARVVEEVSLSKDVEERSETVKDTVRKTEVDTDNLEKDNLTGNDRYRNNDL